MDKEKHWRACTDKDCKEVSEEGEHEMRWIVTREATKDAAGEETGTCRVCGYKATRPLQYVEPEKAVPFQDLAQKINPAMMTTILCGIGGFLVLVLLGVLINGIVKRRRR